MKLLLKAIFLISFVFCSTFVFAEEITITTYYPSPYGSYNELTTTGNTYLATTTSGKVGIGTTSPSLKLDVRGQPPTNPYVTPEFYENIIQATRGSVTLRLGIRPSVEGWQRYGGIEVDDGGIKRPLLLQKDGGKVGIGGRFPILKFDVWGSNAKWTTAAFENLIQIRDTATTPLALRLGIKTDATGGNRYGAIEVDDEGIKRPLLLQKDGGNVGIGTANPVANLDVRGGIYIEGGSGDVNNDGSVNVLDATKVGQYLVNLIDFTPEELSRADVDGDGRVTLEDKYMIAGMVLGISKYNVIRNSHSTYGAWCTTWSGGGCTKKAFVVADPANVGIGTSDPGARLDVAGSVYFEGGSGDTNNNGVIADVGDCVRISGYLTGSIIPTRQEYATADIDGDGRVTVDDAYACVDMSTGTSKREAVRKVHIIYGAQNNGGFAANQLYALANGNVGIGTASPEGALDVVSTTGAFIVPRMTTAQRNALTAVNGMIIYNTTTTQFNFRENGAWVLK